MVKDMLFCNKQDLTLLRIFAPLNANIPMSPTPLAIALSDESTLCVFLLAFPDFLCDSDSTLYRVNAFHSMAVCWQRWGGRWTCGIPGRAPAGSCAVGHLDGLRVLTAVHLDDHLLGLLLAHVAQLACNTRPGFSRLYTYTLSLLRTGSLSSQLHLSEASAVANTSGRNPKNITRSGSTHMSYSIL